MRYLLLVTVNPDLVEGLSAMEQDAILRAHDDFEAATTESGELVGYAVLADPSTSKTVRVWDGGAAVTDGPYFETEEFLAGYYVVECDSDERACELAATIPDAKRTGIEVRAVMSAGGLEM